MSREELERLWADPQYWTLVYRCPLDPRVIVPRRRPWMGWTVNFAHPRAWPVVLLAVLVAVVPGILLLGFFPRAPWMMVGGMVISVCLLVSGSHWEATRSRE